MRDPLVQEQSFWFLTIAFGIYLKKNHTVENENFHYFYQ